MGTKPTHHTLHRFARLLALLAIAWLVGCNNTPPKTTGHDTGFNQLQSDIPLPTLVDDPLAQDRPTRIHAIIQRIDVPLDQSTDNAWATTDELIFPAITRSIWHANGLRLGLLSEDDVEPFAQHMPTVLELYETQVYTSTHPIPIMRTPRLSNNVRIPVDLTLPPAPPHHETIIGGGDGKLQLLARLEVVDGKTYIILTPHHAQPQANRLQPRDILERELDGRVFDELSIRVELTPDRLLVVGLYWPWPIGEAFEDDDQVVRSEQLPQLDVTWLTNAPSPLEDDPAAPPQHLRQGVPDRPETIDPDNNEDSRNENSESGNDADPTHQPASIQRIRIAPPLPIHFGRILLTGTRARKPVQTLLLISIPPDTDPPNTDPPNTPPPDDTPPTDPAADNPESESESTPD